jgi:hypothetical protein
MISGLREKPRARPTSLTSHVSPLTRSEEKSSDGEGRRRIESNAYRLAMMGLCLLLCSPAVFKLRLPGDVILHPFVPLLVVAWGWIGWAIVRLRQQPILCPVSPEWRVIMNVTLWAGSVTAGLAGSLVINGLLTGSWPLAGWLLLLKSWLYLAPLPFVALVITKRSQPVFRLLGCLIPPVALLTLVYSFLRFTPGSELSYANAESGAEPRYFVMGMFGEVWSGDGLLLRTDTVAQGAYGMYLVLVVLFSLALATIKGWDGGLPLRYRRGQAWILCPAAVVGILYSGSRSSLILLCGVILTAISLTVWRGTQVLSGPHPLRFIGLLLLVTAGSAWSIQHVAPVSFQTVHRLQESTHGRYELKGSLFGSFSPLTTLVERTSAVRNVESRLWIWGKSIRYLVNHPAALLVGIGNDRRGFVEEVMELSYEGDNRHFGTAHNLYLDLLIKGGVLTLMSLFVACTALVRLAVKAVKLEPSNEREDRVAGLGMVLLAFWIPFLFVNLLGEEMFTDNLQIHWTILWGTFIGLYSKVDFSQTRHG